MSRLSDDLGIDLKPSEEGVKVKNTRELLDQYGVQGKQVDILPVAEQSTIVLQPGEVIQTANFFAGKSPSNSNRSIEFPHKTKAFNISYIAVDVDINLAENKQETLKALQYFLKNSTIKTKWMRGDHLSVPLSECVPFVIEFDGHKYTTRVVRTGFYIKDGIKIPMNGEFEVEFVPAPRYSTHATAVNPEPEQPNVIRLTLIGHSLQVPVGA